MCFGGLSTSELCEICGRHHPRGAAEQCFERRAEQEAGGLEAELSSFLDSSEARFLSWLAARDPR